MDKWLVTGAQLPTADPAGRMRVLGTLEALDFFPTPAKARAQKAIADADQAIRKLLFNQSQTDIGRGEKLVGRAWVTRRPLWADRLACAWLVRRFVDPEGKVRWLEKTQEPPDGSIGFGFDGAHFASSEARVTYEEIVA